MTKHSRRKSPRRSKDKGIKLNSRENCLFNFGTSIQNVSYNKNSKQCCDGEIEQKDNLLNFQYLKDLQDNSGFCYDKNEKALYNRYDDFNKMKKKLDILSKNKNTNLINFAIANDPTKFDYLDWIIKNENKLKTDSELDNKLYELSQLKYKEGYKREYIDEEGKKQKQVIDFDDIYYNEVPDEINKINLLLNQLNELDNTIKTIKEQKSIGLLTHSFIELYNGIYGKLLIPLDKDTSCKLGSGTKWCTAAKSDNMFDHYNDKGPLFIWNDQKLNNKFQFHFEEFQFMDDKDDPIISDMVYLMLDVPALNELFTNRLTKVHNLVKFAFEKLNIKNKKTFEELFNEHLQYIFNTPLEVSHYVYYYNNMTRMPELEPMILQDAKASYFYAENIIRKRWTEAEPIIATNANTARKYAFSFLNTRWINVKGIDKNVSEQAENSIKEDANEASKYVDNTIRNRWPEAELIIATKMESAYNYAYDTLKKRWIYATGINMKIAHQAEKLIMQDSDKASRYADEVIKGRWPEAEPYIAKSANSALFYAKTVLSKIRWINVKAIDKKIAQQAEQSIMEDSDTALEYVIEIIKQRWPEAEPYILKKTKNIYNYIDTVIQQRWPEAEEKIAKDGLIAADYSFWHLNMRWIDVPNIDPKISQQAEKSIKENGLAAVKYASYFMKGRWPEGEPYISKSADASLIYAKHILSKRWIDVPEIDPKIAQQAEDSISKDADKSLDYIRKFIKGRWLKAERAISKNISKSLEYAYDIINGRFLLSEDTILLEPKHAANYAKKIIQGPWDKLDNYIKENNLSNFYSDYVKWRIKF